MHDTTLVDDNGLTQQDWKDYLYYFGSFSRAPSSLTQQAWVDPSFRSLNLSLIPNPCHSRAPSGQSSSLYSTPSVYDSLNQQITEQLSEGSVHSRASSSQSSTPNKCLVRQHGPLLLPKIRPQDQIIEPSSRRFRKMSSSITQNPLGTAQKPGHTRSTDRKAKNSSIVCLDDQSLRKYGFPYRQMPAYIPSATNPPTEILALQPYLIPTACEPSPIRHEAKFTDDSNLIPEPTTTLMNYLTAANPAPSLVRQLNTHDRNAKYFWWDIRQIRPWTSFTPATIATIPGLQALLTIAVPCSSLPTPPAPRSTHPETEAELHSIYSSFYTTKLNAALAIAQGYPHLMMRFCTQVNQPYFISNYTDDTSELIYGRGLGRVVGLVKSFDRWNSGMRVEGNHKKVEYLRGLSHLHKCMREHGCRYGFIMTEIELVVVRNGAENTPHFGYLEIQTIQLATYKSKAELQAEPEVDEEGNVIEKESKMTALLALFYLHMLARDAPLPGQVGWKTEIGAPAERTRAKCLPRDSWMPEPQLTEKREAKRTRGWVWPNDAVGRKELGRRGVNYSNVHIRQGVPAH